MGLFDGLQLGGSSGGGGLLDFLRQYAGQNGNLQPWQSVDPSIAQQVPAQPQGGPVQSTPNLIPIGGYNGYMMPSFGMPDRGARQPSSEPTSSANMIPIGGYGGYMMPSFGLPSDAPTAIA